ncbi:hypothetical protein [Streptomyces indicus]|uniref:Uncharacterized protein n=1 Tax=Streptomyces indicus TaxID=417292 RepID=A0A1G8WCR3_9ACTN|nr:hypothetical protein [Streptomyces indicus]SDJ75907.1 hypothetical protein SAMN05421806_102375 [Streptomyces indicus]
MGRLPAPLRVPLVTGLAMVLIVGAGVLVLGPGEDEGGHLAANRAQLKRACGGLLPYEELRGLVPDDVPGEVLAYGAQLTPDEESRALLHCEVTWPDHGGVSVEAAPLLSELPEPLSVAAGELLPGPSSEGYEARGVTGRAGEQAPTWLVAECPEGLGTRAREVPGMYVTVSVDRFGAGAEKSGGKADALRELRTGVAVANALSRAQKCGSEALALPDAVVDTYEAEVTSEPDGSNIQVQGVDIPGLGLAKCRGLAKGLPGTWSVAGDLQESRLLSVCDATQRGRGGETDEPELEEGEVFYVSAASWAGPLRESAWHGDHEDAGVALWATARCAAGPTLHRVAVTLEYDDPYADEYGDETPLTKEQRARYERQTRKALDAYLADPGGWPRQQRCHDTHVLGKAEAAL